MTWAPGAFAEEQAAYQTRVISLAIMGGHASSLPFRVALSMAALAGVPSGAHAQPGEPTAELPEEVSETPTTHRSAVDDARAAFDEGLALEAAGQQDAACASYRESLKLVRELGPLRRVASCEERAGALLLAITLLEELVDRLPSEDPARIDSSNDVARLRSRLARLVLSKVSGAPDAAVQVDGRAVQLPAIVELDPGSHRIVVEVPGEPPAVTTLDMPAGTSHELAVPRPAERVVEPPPQKKGPRGAWIAGWTVGSFGLAGFAAAGITGAKLLSDQAEFDECVAERSGGCQAIADGAEGALIANGFAWGIGAAATAVGATLLIVDGLERSEAPVSARVGLGSVSVSVQF